MRVGLFKVRAAGGDAPVDHDGRDGRDDAGAGWWDGHDVHDVRCVQASWPRLAPDLDVPSVGRGRSRRCRMSWTL